MTAQTLPSIHFDSSTLPPDQQLAAQARFMVNFRIDAPESEKGFYANSMAWPLGPLVISLSSLGPLDIVRTLEMIRADHVDHYVVVLLLSDGHWEGEFDGRPLRVESGEICILDMTRPMHTVSPATTSVTMMIPRAMLDEALPPFAMHGLVLDAPFGRLLTDYIKALVARLPTVQVEEANAVARGTRDLLAATLTTVRQRSAAQTSPALLVRAKRHIAQNLKADLSVGAICAALAISRSSLFRAFEAVGGVESYVQARRLARAHDLLERPDEHRSIAEIGFEGRLSQLGAFLARLQDGLWLHRARPAGAARTAAERRSGRGRHP